MADEQYAQFYRERTTRGTRRRVWSDGERIVKEYRFLRWFGDLQRPWAREHRCLARLQQHGVPAPRSFGIDHPDRGLVRHRREFVAGAHVAQLDPHQCNALAGHLAHVHSARVTMGDVSLANLLLTTDGRLLLLDYGRGRTFWFRSPLFYFYVGKELARMRRRVLNGSPSTWEAFCTRYRNAAQYPPWAWRIIWISVAYWCRRWLAPRQPTCWRWPWPPPNPSRSLPSSVGHRSQTDAAQP